MLRDDQRRSLDAWCRQVAPRALAYARSLLRDPVAAEDVVQDCFYRLLRHADEYDLLRDGVKLLFRAISNKCINAITRRRTVLSLEITDEEGHSELTHADPSCPLPEQLAIRNELQAAITAALAKLPEMQRAALELAALGQSKAEIGEILEVTPSNAGVLVHRARKALQEELGLRSEEPENKE
jgi:RNA polymerase sigma-70 factor (ECF subfamily)